MKHLPDLLTFCDIGVHFSVHPSVHMSVCQHLCRSFNIYVEASILINYKTKTGRLYHTLLQAGAITTNKPCMKHLPDLLTLWDRRPLFRSSVRSSVRLSSVLLCRSSKFYVKVSILINYKTKQEFRRRRHRTCWGKSHRSHNQNVVIK